MPRLLLTFLALTLALAGSLPAAGFESWNTVEALIIHSERWRLDCGGFIRIDHNATYPYDDGLRCRVSVSLTPRFTVMGGMVQRWLDNTDKGFVAEERPFGGVAILIAKAPVRVESTVEMERFFYPSGKAAYNRYRSKIDLERPAKFLAPVLSTEVFFTADGLVRTRSIVGVRHRMEGGGRWECGYQFQSDSTNKSWVPKHAIRTAVYFGDLFRGR